MEFKFCLILLIQFFNSISDIGAENLSSLIKNNERTICSNFYENQNLCFATCEAENLFGIDSNIHAQILCVNISPADIIWTTLNDTENNDKFAIQISTAADQSNAIYLINNTDDEKRFLNLTADTKYYVLILKISPSGSVSINDVASLKFKTHIENPKPPAPSWFNVTELIPVNDTIANLKIKWNFSDEALPCHYVIYWWRDQAMELTKNYDGYADNSRLHELTIPNLMYENTYRIWMMSRFGCKKNGTENKTEIRYNIPRYCKVSGDPSINCPIPSVENITEKVDCNRTSKCLVDVSWMIQDFQPGHYFVKVEKFDRNVGNWSLVKTLNVTNTFLTKMEVTFKTFYQLTIITFKNGSASSPSIHRFRVDETRRIVDTAVERKPHPYYLFAIISIFVFLLVLISGVIHIRIQQNNKSLNKTYSVEIKNKEILESIIPNVEGIKNTAQANKYQLILGKILGKGNFGIVYYGKLMSNNKKIVDVAVKTLQDNATAKEIQQFEKEINLMEDVGFHNNIVCMIGSLHNAKKPLLIVEFCALGDLHSYLRDIRKTLVNFSDFNPTVGNQYQNLVTVGNGEQNSKHLVQNKIYGVTTKDFMVPELSICDLLSFGRQVTIGMEYLASNYVVHRDLAARNVLLCNDKTVKISDFGLSRDIYAENIYRKLEGSERMPIKWMALESIRNQEYTTLSDVWSFGIFLWELFTMGDEPYPDISCPEVLYLRLKQGYRMKNFSVSYPELYRIMDNCWQETPELRPQFSELHELLDQMLEKCSPNQYITITGTE